MPPPFPKRLVIAEVQQDQLRRLVAAILPDNPFYAGKFDATGAPRRVRSIREFTLDVPFTTKQELVEDQLAHPPYGANLTFPMERYTRCHQTSGTKGAPLRWLDTAESWDWIVRNWEHVLRNAGVTAADRVFFPFSFGPFLEFWGAFEAAARLGCLCLPGGGFSSTTRLRAILDHGATVLCTTPTYAFRLAQVAVEEKISLETSPVRLILTAGEPGGCIPATRDRLKELWPGARVYDHHGMTETGAVTYECPAREGVLHVMEEAFLPEVIDPATSRPAEAGETGELVLTTLGRLGSPVLRYRTGDLVKPAAEVACDCGCQELALEGGILGRADDMVIVRGVKIFPSAVEEIIRAVGSVAEYQVRVSQVEALPRLSLTIEPTPHCSDVTALVHALKQAFANAFAMHVPVETVLPGTLPRFEMKAKRWVSETTSNGP